MIHFFFASIYDSNFLLTFASQCIVLQSLKHCLPFLCNFVLYNNSITAVNVSTIRYCTNIVHCKLYYCYPQIKKCRCSSYITQPFILFQSFIALNIYTYCLQQTNKLKHLSHGLVVWSACANNRFLRTFRVQKKAIRIIGKSNSREYCQPQLFKTLQLLTLPSFYVFKIISFYMSTCALTRCRDINRYETQRRDSDTAGRHRTAVNKHLPSQQGVHLTNRLPNFIKLHKYQRR